MLRSRPRLGELAGRTLASVGVGSLLMLAPAALGTTQRDVLFVGHHGRESVAAVVKQSGGKLVIRISLQCQRHGLPTGEELPNVKVASSGKFSDSGTARYVAGYARQTRTKFKLKGSLKSSSGATKLASLKSVSVDVKPTAGCPWFSGKLAKNEIPPAS